MKVTTPRPNHLALLAFGALLPVGFAFGQTDSTASSSPDPKTDNPVHLSPFTVNSGADKGYYSPNAVSGTRTQTPLIDLPMPITVFTQEFIQDIDARDLIDVVEYASGITKGVGGASATNDGDTLGFTIRGQASALPTRNGYRRLRAVDPSTIERVEVLKGPASLLYGQVNPGGSVNYITKRPVQDQSINNFEVDAGSYSLYRATGDMNIPLNLPIVPGKISIRLVGSTDDSQSIVARYHKITQAMDPSLTWWYLPGSSITVEWESTKNNINAFKSGLPYNSTQDFLSQHYPIDRTWNTHAGSDYLDTDIRVLTAELVHRFASYLTLRANVSHDVWYDNEKADGSNINIITDASGNPTNLLQPRGLQWGERGSWDDYREFELVNNFSFLGIQVQNLAGYEYAHEQFRQVLGTIAPANTGVSWNLRDPSTWILTSQSELQTTNNPASSGTISTNITSSTYFTNQLTMFQGKFHTLAGVRFDHFRQEGFNPPATHVASSAKPATSPQVGALYEIIPGLSIYTSYSQSFLALFNGLAMRRDGTTFYPTPQKGKGYDSGIKWELFGGKIAGTASVFELENTNIVRQYAQQPLLDGSGGLYVPTEQSGTDRSTGFETDLHFRPWDTTQITMSYANTDAYVESDDSAFVKLPNGQIYLTRQGHRLQNAPKDTFSFWGKQELGQFGPIKNAYLLGGARYASKRAFIEAYNIINGVPTAPPDLGSYVLFDAGIGAHFDLKKIRYTSSLMVKNLTDKIYLVERFHFGDPRTFEFSERVSF